MRLTIIGKSPAWQDAGGACSSYLVRHASGSLLVDCGNGAFGKLRHLADHREVGAVVITHMHGDHVLDLIPFSYALTYGPAFDGPRPKLFLPPNGLEVMRTICGSFDSPTLVEEAFDAVEYDPARQLRIGEVSIEFHHVPHFIDAWALRLTEGGARLVFGSDCGPSESLSGFAEAADVLLLEATFAHDAEERDGHLTPGQAGAIAAAARVGRLVLTHISDCLDLAASRAAAEASFGGPVEIAETGSSWDI